VERDQLAAVPYNFTFPPVGSPKSKNVTTLLKVVGTLALMVVSGIVLYVTAILIVMELGIKFHGNFEYYAQNYPILGLPFIFGLGAIGFLAPGVVVWHLHKRERPLQFSLRTLLIAMTLICVVLGIGVWFFSWLFQPSI